MTVTETVDVEPVVGDGRLTRSHARVLTWWAVLAIAVVMPAMLAAWIIASSVADWDPIFTARAANVCGMALLVILLFGPLSFRRYPWRSRLRGFVLLWFFVSPFFNLVWQLPLILFKETITGAEVNADNLPQFISWWGYGSIDSHYGTVSPFMVASELGWLVAMAIALAGLVTLLRGSQRIGYLLAGVGGALQAYNASFYILENGIVDGFDNVANDSFMAPLLYFGFAIVWSGTAATASVISFRFLLRLADRSG